MPGGGGAPTFAGQVLGEIPREIFVQSPNGEPPRPRSVFTPMTSTLQKPTLLIAEDDKHLRTLVIAVAERTGAYSAVHAVPDGQAAVEWIHGTMRDHEEGQDGLVVLSDLNMPRMTGLELIRELKHDPKTRDIPIVIMTSSNQPSDRDDVVAAGCTAFFFKAQRFDEMTAMLASLPAICGAGVHAST
jgi:CheY-like chemotaxis protein